jgi:hypothetical protein
LDHNLSPLPPFEGRAFGGIEAGMAHVGEVGSGQIIERAVRSVDGLLQRMLDFLRTR